MQLTDYRLGELIEPCFQNNYKEELGIDSVKGISTGKVFIETKADMTDVSLKSYLIVEPNQFAFVPDTSRRGEKIALAYNDLNETILISSIYQVFKVKYNDRLLPDYLYIWFNRVEFDRYSRFNSWGSAREVFSWNEMCSIQLKLPPLPVQQKAVDVYNAIKANLAAYTEGIDEMKLTCDLLLDNIKHTYKKEKIGSFLREIDIRNSNAEISNVLGININKTFMPSVANLEGTSLSKYKVIKKGLFVYSAMQTGRDETIRVALYDDDEKAIISPAYSILQVVNDEVLPEFLMTWFRRSEFDRYGWFLSDASVRSSLELPRFFDIEIPIPPIDIQQSIVDIYHAQAERQQIAGELSNTLKEICPVLIRQSLSG